MSSLINDSTKFSLSREKLEASIEEIKFALKGRVASAYIFGSASTGEINPESDIDLILIQESPKLPFVQRPFEFGDLFQIYPKLDILVYTPAEFAQQLADSSVGFWKSVRLTMKKIV